MCGVSNSFGCGILRIPGERMNILRSDGPVLYSYIYRTRAGRAAAVTLCAGGSQEEREVEGVRVEWWVCVEGSSVEAVFGCGVRGTGWRGIGIVYRWKADF